MPKSVSRAFLLAAALWVTECVLGNECVVGDCENGEGRMDYGQGVRYDGFFQNFVPHGLGRMEHPNGAYTGNFERGVPHGLGAMTFPDGSKYQGAMENGQKHGNGRVDYPDGSVYEGGFHHNEKSGKGVTTHASGDQISGSWHGNRFVESGAGPDL
jgi:hypothetical protein